MEAYKNKSVIVDEVKVQKKFLSRFLIFAQIKKDPLSIYNYKEQKDVKNVGTFSTLDPKTTCKKCWADLEPKIGAYTICENGWFYCHNCHRILEKRDPYNHDACEPNYELPK